MRKPRVMRKGNTLMKSVLLRNNPLFLRNTFQEEGRWGIPVIKRQELPLDNLRILSYNNTAKKANPLQKQFGVHFFVDDQRFEQVYNFPERSYKRLSQYKFLLTPDFSLYREMSPWQRINGIGRSRWCGAFWQSKGSIVIPTISWSTAESFDYAFDGIEQHSIVAIGMIGCKNSKRTFLDGFFAMKEKIQPSHIICIGNPFAEMKSSNLSVIDYANSWRG